jgi:hypothetical protein
VLADDAGRSREAGDEPDPEGLGGASGLAREQAGDERESDGEF